MAELVDVHNLGFDLVRATEHAALQAGRWVGLGDRAGADDAAAQAMMAVLDTLPID
jgi:fructose-1,6-bisphosphatase II